MKTVIKENYEKALLASMLLTLAIVSVISIISVRDKTPPVLVGGGKEVSPFSIPAFKNIENNFMADAQKKSLELFVYCRNAKCSYLVHKSLVKCNWCKTPIIAEEVFENDLNKNKIDDKLELQWGLKLDDPNELLRDHDTDGFSTLDEYELDFSPVESSSHPPLALRATFVGIKNKFIPFKINDIVIKKDIRGNRRVYVDGTHFKRGSFYLSVGEETNWLKIINAGEENGMKFAELEYFDFKFKIWKGEKQQYSGWPKYMIRNAINNSSILVGMGEEFQLKSKSGEEEIYKLLKFEMSKNEVHILYKVISDVFVLNKKESLKEPLQK